MNWKSERAKALQAIAAVFAAADGAKRPVTDEELKAVEGHKARVEECDGQIAREVKIADLRQQSEAALAETRSAESTAAPKLPEGAVVTRVRASVEDDPKRGYRSVAHYGLDVAAASVPHGHPLKGVVGEPSANFRVLAAMTQGSKIDGGVFVPPAFSTQTWDRARQASNSLLQYCDVFTMDGGTESLTFPAVAETSRANGSRWGGVQGRWKTETTTMTSTSPTFREVKFEPQELYIFTKVSDKLLRNVAALNAFLGVAAGDELNFKIGDAIINGTGTGMPKGVLAGTAGTDACRVSVSKETGQAAATVVKENVDKMWSRCHANWRANAVWFINQDVEPQLEQLSAAVGTGGVPVYLPPGGIADTPNARLKGRPVVPIEYAATLGTVGDIMLLNLAAYGIALRGLVDSAMSAHLYFDTMHTAFRWVFEMDGQPWLRDAITPYKGTANTLSPFVVLATRA